jgi:archaeal type IV pilus assembly protein PilA
MIEKNMTVKFSKHRGVAPVIATLLMVAIAVVGGTIIFVFSQGFFSSSQLSSDPNIEFVRVIGYDGRDVPELTSQIGAEMVTANSGGDGDGKSEQHERITVHVTNDSVKTIIINKILFGGVEYAYAAANTLDTQGPLSNIPGGQYDVLVKTDGIVDVMLNKDRAEIKAGQTVDIILALDTDYKQGRDIQFRLETDHGAVFLSSVLIGSDNSVI